VVAVGRSPGFWSGIVAVFQRVHYRVVEQLRGDPLAADVVVQHPIIGPPTTERDEPRLSSAIWCEGARLIVVCAHGGATVENGRAPDLHALHDPYRDDTDAGRRLRTALDAR
jgi:hypothetical protein